MATESPRPVRLYPPPPRRQGGDGLPQSPSPLLVVGLVGLESSANASLLANTLLDLPVFPLGRSERSEESAEAELLMYVDAEHGVAYVVLTSHTDGLDMIARSESLAAADGAAAVHAWLTERRSERALLVLFHVCHAVLVVSEARCASSPSVGASRPRREGKAHAARVRQKLPCCRGQPLREDEQGDEQLARAEVVAA